MVTLQRFQPLAIHVTTNSITCNKRVLSIALPDNNLRATADRLFSDLHLDQFEIIIIDLSNFVETEFLDGPKYNIPTSVLKVIESLAGHLKKKLGDFLARGSDIVVITRLLRLIDSPGPHSTSLDLNKVFLNDLAQPFPGRGTHVEYCGPEELMKLAEPIGADLEYHALLKSPDLIPLFRAKGTMDVISGVLLTEGGCVLFVPPPGRWDSKHSSAEDSKRRTRFLEGALLLLEAAKTQLNKKPEIPAWAEGYTLPGEAAKVGQIAEIDQRIAEFQENKRAQEDALEIVRRHKLLFAGEGRALESEVDWALVTLGFQVSSSSHNNRVDRIARHGDRVIVLEIKGKAGSAAERDAAQLDKWVSEYFSEHSIEPKGILIVNAFRTELLEARTQSPFPDQLIPYCTKRSFCLITGIQLLNLALAAIADSSKAHELANLLFDAVGPLQGFDDWRMHVVRRAS